MTFKGFFFHGCLKYKRIHSAIKQGQVVVDIRESFWYVCSLILILFFYIYIYIYIEVDKTDRNKWSKIEKLKIVIGENVFISSSFLYNITFVTHTHIHTHTHNQHTLSIYPHTYGGARGVMVIVAGIGHGDTSSNPGLIAFHITLGKGMNPIILPPIIITSYG